MKVSRHRWLVVATFFFFILLHQADKLLIGPLTTPIMETFGIDEAQMGLVFSGAIIVGAIFYPLWGFLFDMFSRTKLLSLASFIWGSTTWLSALAGTYPLFLASRASTGIDDSCYPGIYNTVADYFKPSERGKVNGILGLGGPLGYLLGMVLGIFLLSLIGWRNIFIVTGAMGIVLSFIIFFFIREPVRGGTEPEFANAQSVPKVSFNWKAAGKLLKKRTLLAIFSESFFGVIPWQVITFWFFRYLETERGYAPESMFLVMVIVVLVLAAGYPIGGMLGDRLFRLTKRGRLIVSTTGILLGTVFLTLAMTTPNSQALFFEITLGLAALFMPMAAPNGIATIYDVTEPEVRSTAQSMMNFLEQVGSALAPAVAGFIAVRASLGTAILGICTGAWAICLIFSVIAILVVPRDIEALRAEMQSRTTA
jgi:MFS family permease